MTTMKRLALTLTIVAILAANIWMASPPVGVRVHRDRDGIIADFWAGDAGFACGIGDDGGIYYGRWLMRRIW